MIGIYKITNLLNNKVYIGQSRNISERWRSHRTKYQTQDYPLYRAIRKYGIDNFSFEVIEECEIDKLNDREIYWIAYYNANNKNNGYNLTEGGSSVSPLKLTQEDVLQIIKYLSTTVISQQDLAQMFNVSQRTISSINTGETWIQEDINYPIRKSGIVNKFKGIDTNSLKIEDEIKKIQNKCKICGMPISKSSTYCNSCKGKINRIVEERPNREELKFLIRSYPFTKIGEQFGVSDNAIRKWCKSENLPFRAKDIKNYSDEEWKEI